MDLLRLALRLGAVALCACGVLFYGLGASLLPHAPIKGLCTCATGAASFGVALLLVTL